MSQIPVTVRNASEADARLLAEVGARTFDDTFTADNKPEDMAAYLSSAFGPEIQAAELADPHALFLIAEVDGEAAGYAKLQEGVAPGCVTGDKPIEIVRLYAERGYHGRGVGAALMLECLRAAERRGARTIWLGVWEHNRRALAFYRKWGFTEVGSHEFRLGADIQTDVIMVKPL